MERVYTFLISLGRGGRRGGDTSFISLYFFCSTYDALLHYLLYIPGHIFSLLLSSFLKVLTTFFSSARNCGV